MRHVMVDIETLGSKPGSVILSIGACVFDSKGVAERFYRPIDVFDSLMQGLTVDPATVDWWRQQSADAKGALRPTRPLLEVLGAFTAFVKGDPGDMPLVWAKGPDFDLVLLDAAYRALGSQSPWRYNAARDVRTMLSLAPDTSNLVVPNAREHHALADAEYQALCVIVAANQLGVKLENLS